MDCPVSASAARNRVSPAKSAKARVPTFFISLGEVLSPTAAMATTRHARAVSFERCADRPRYQSQASRDDERDEGDEKQWQQGLALVLGRLPAAPPDGKRDRRHDRQQHRHTQELGQHGEVADLGRDAVAGADNLRNVVDRRTEKESGRARIEPEPLDDDGVGDHRDRRQRRDAGDRENELALGLLVARQHARDRHRRGGAADRGGARRQDAEATRDADHLRRHRAKHERRDDTGDHQQAMQSSPGPRSTRR